jgi:hypothetical protein
MSAYPATALLGHRLNAFRLNYLDGRIYITIGGGVAGGAAQGLLCESLTIQDRLNEVPNTLIATVRGTKPIEGQVIAVTIGSQNGSPVFRGNVLRVTRVWAAENPAHVLYHVEATDPTWRLNAYLFSARYRNQSASTIAADLLTKAPAGFTGKIEPGLPVLDEITFTNATLMDAFVQLATRIGGYTLVDYNSVVYLFTTPDTVTTPAPLTAAHKSLAGVSYVRDLTQIITRAVVEGGGGNALTGLPAGATVIPVDVIGWYSNAGGYVRSGPQRMQYTGITAGGAGAFAGEGTTPTSAPTAAAAGNAGGAGPGLEPGTHQYGYTWVTGAGETLPSPLSAAVLMVAAPAALTPGPTLQTPNMNSNSEGYLVVGATYRYAYSYSSAAAYATVDPATESQLSVVTTVVTVPGPTGMPGGGTPGASDDVDVRFPASTNPNDKWVHVWRSKANGTTLYFESQLGSLDARQTYWRSWQADGVIPTTQAPAQGQSINMARVSAIAPGPLGVTARRIYRTPANSAQLKLWYTIADNTQVGPLDDASSDASLGANAPTVDTAGIIQTAKLIPAGSTVMRLTSTGPFPPAGGFAIVGGSQVIRYSAATATDLTGIPATGEGALLQSVPWGTAVTVAPALTGIPASGLGSVRYPILKGDPVNVVAVVDDAAAQTALAALVGGDGVRESLLQDGRISLTEATARGRALLAGHSLTRETFAHRSRDLNTRSGAVVTVDLPAPTDIHGSFRLQDVTISTFNPRGLVPPTYTASASSQRYTFEDLLRQLANTSPAPATGEDR